MVFIWKYTYLTFLKSVKLFLSRMVFPAATMFSTIKQEKGHYIIGDIKFIKLLLTLTFRILVKIASNG